MKQFLISLALFFTCQALANLPNAQGWQDIYGRAASATERVKLYRAKVPSDWERKDPQGSNEDTMLPLCEFHIGKGPSSIKITIHNFPTKSIAQRIPPQAQVQRWKQQLNITDSWHILVTPIARGGFTGLFFSADLSPTATLAWTMQMAEEHYQHLQNLATHSLSGRYYEQMSADYTIKAVGPKEALLFHREPIINFAHSFELIEAIPSR